MTNDVTIDEKCTLTAFNYYSTELSHGSNRPVIVHCIFCQLNFERPFRSATNKHRCKRVVGDRAYCKSCKNWKPASEFGPRKNKILLREKCSVCHTTFNTKDRRAKRLKIRQTNNHVEYIKYRLPTMQAQAKQRGLEWNLTKEYLIGLWDNQNGKCHYSNIQMNNASVVTLAEWTSPSLDRIDPNKGYVKDNVVWCIWGVNSFKASLLLNEFQTNIKQIKWWFER